MKDKILEKAGELFMKYGVRSVTMDDIAREIAISKKTIYQFFKDKDDIVNHVAMRHMDKEKKEYDEIQSSSHNALEELAKINRCVRKNFREMNPALLYDLQKYHRDAWNLFEEFKHVYIKNSVANNLRKGIAEGHFRKEIDPDIIAAMRVQVVEMAFDETLFPQDKYDFREVQMELFDHYVHGLVTNEGLKLYEAYLKKENDMDNSNS